VDAATALLQLAASVVPKLLRMGVLLLHLLLLLWLLLRVLQTAAQTGHRCDVPGVPARVTGPSDCTGAGASDFNKHPCHQQPSSTLV
jgi:hypothetical protein